jgi:O-acetyl-ADP-ribose deacetylase (regulator of RNase III)
MIELTRGNLLEAPAEALVNTVNTAGIMGKGVALQFKQAFPEIVKPYAHACRTGELRTGVVQVIDRGGLLDGPRWIINFPTKGHWRSGSRLEDIASGLSDLIKVVDRMGIRSIAIPPLGCGLGGLDWARVRPLIEAAFGKLDGVRVLLFAPNGDPPADSMPNRTGRPRMTPGRAALLVLMDRYLKGLLDPFVSLLEVHKMMYLLQQAGEPLSLRFEARPFGPYAVNLRQVLIRLEHHYLEGYGAGNDHPSTPLRVLPGAVDEARAFLEAYPETLKRMDRVFALMEGYEDPYGMELLGSVLWVMEHEPAARMDAEESVASVQRWSHRKQKELKADHIRMAWRRLEQQHWGASISLA